jgi:hypothetical protein
VVAKQLAIYMFSDVPDASWWQADHKFLEEDEATKKPWIHNMQHVTDQQMAGFIKSDTDLILTVVHDGRKQWRRRC